MPDAASNESEGTVNVAIVPVVAFKLEAKRLVRVVCSPVAFVHVRFVNKDGDTPLTVSVLMEAFVANRLVAVADVNTAVDGVIAPIGELLIVLPSSVRIFEIFASVSVPEMAPKSPIERVTAPFPSTPPLIAEAFILPVASTVRPLTTKASVIEFDGKARPEPTIKFVRPAFTAAIEPV